MWSTNSDAVCVLDSCFFSLSRFYFLRSHPSPFYPTLVHVLTFCPSVLDLILAADTSSVKETTARGKKSHFGCCWTEHWSYRVRGFIWPRSTLRASVNALMCGGETGCSLVVLHRWAYILKVSGRGNKIAVKMRCHRPVLSLLTMRKAYTLTNTLFINT